MKVQINREKCEGHARCNVIAGDLFLLDDAGYIDIDGFEVPAGREEDARLASDSCPERVISVVGD